MPLSESDVPWRRLLSNALVTEPSMSAISASLELACNNSEDPRPRCNNISDLHHVCVSRSRLHLQKETLSSKSKNLANIEELEELIPLLKDARTAEINVAVSKAVEKALAEERANIAAQVLHHVS